MARTALICVDTYVSDGRGKLEVGTHRELKIAEEAPRRAAFSIGKSSAAE